MLRIVPPSDCMLAREAVSARVDGELAELDALRLDLHLHACGECRAFAAEASALAQALRTADLEPVPGTLFTPVAGRRPRVAAPLAAAVASLVIAAAAGSSALIGRLVADHSTHTAATAAIAGDAANNTIAGCCLTTSSALRARIGSICLPGMRPGCQTFGPCGENH